MNKRENERISLGDPCF